MFCLLAARGGPSSSSLLKVRSMTWAIGRFPLRGRDDGVRELESSLDEAAGVWNVQLGAAPASLFRALTRMSGISTMSSSSSSSSYGSFPLLKGA